MTSRKLRSYEEKINGFLKYSLYVGSWHKSAYLKKYFYMSEDEIASVITQCKAIECFAVDLATTLSTNKDIWNTGKLTDAIKVEMESAISARYPYLEPRRVLALIGLGWLWVVK